MWIPGSKPNTTFCRKRISERFFFLTKAADATSMAHRWDFDGSSVTTGELQLLANGTKDCYGEIVSGKR